MYKLHLILKYLRKRRIAWVSLVAVMLCTAMVLVVISVMGGWLRMFRESFHGLTGDVIVHGDSLTGFPYYQEMLDKVDWTKYGVVDGVARDPRCENCMVHCGYDPSGALGTNYQSGDNWKNIKYNFGAKPLPYWEGRKINAFNGYSAGKGHLAQAKQALKSGLAGAKSAFQNNAHAASGDSCSSTPGAKGEHETAARSAPETTRVGS